MTGPAKMEHHLEVRLWDDVFTFTDLRGQSGRLLDFLTLPAYQLIT